ncbi:uncharacterized protein LOC111374654 [Olea europaea var. sylvestris]|uniref:uncharacterized protein LOC111374654 n=1 Tax=Olea europaea var. sylvestris TaxID=158386 RepID=UPI000C1CDB4D|nr:uncharacterized protein LOC111374654 [Olea europaea var. sylvestris]
MDLLRMSVDGESTINNEIIPQITKEACSLFVHRQRNKRQRDWRNRVKDRQIDHGKRINDAILFKNTSSDSTIVHDSIIHPEFEASTSNEETTNISNCVPVFSIPVTSYVLPKCNYCGAQKFHTESKGFCCSYGKIKLCIPDSPFEIYNLFTFKEPMEFKKIARGYNNHFVFTSFGVKYDKEFFKAYRGIYTFRVQGQVYHYVNRLMPEKKMSFYMQLYFYDTENELQNRMKSSENFVECAFLVLIEILKINPYSHFFRSLSDMNNLHNHRLHIRCQPELDQRVFNTPTTSQVATVWADDDQNTNVRVHDITIYDHSSDSHRVHYNYDCYDPLQYPLLFPFGESGWHEGIKRIKNIESRNRYLPESTGLPNTIISATEIIENEDKVLEVLVLGASKIFCILNGMKKRSQVSCREYYSNKLQIRPTNMYVKIETTKLDYFHNNQKQIRSEIYQDIIDSVKNWETRGYKIGKKFVLPQSFTYGPRDMLRRYVDGMTIVQRYGKPYIFLTITFNSNWSEIKEKLKHNDEVQYRPNLIARVFKAKLEELKKDLYKENIIGPVIAHIYVIKFQKIGFPHTHLLLIFNSGHKISCATDLDRVVSCEIPDKNKYPHLYFVIMKHNMHGHCESLNPKNVCMEVNSSCKNKHPRAYCNSTIFGDSSYPLYRRCDSGIYVKVRG